MATALNHHLPMYVSPFLDHQALDTDAMVVDEQMGHSVSVSSDHGNFSGFDLPFPLQRESHASGSLVGRATVVAQASELVFLPQEVPQSSSISVGERRGSFLQHFMCRFSKGHLY